MNRSAIHIDGDRWVQFSPGSWCCFHYPPAHDLYVNEYGTTDSPRGENCACEPPADWRNPTCETCEGSGCSLDFCESCGDEYSEPCPIHEDHPHWSLGCEDEPCCPDCIDGLRRIAVTEPTFDPHSYSERSARARLGRRRRAGEELIMREAAGQWYTGRLVTVAHAVQDWGPVQVVERPSLSPDSPCLTILPRGMAMLWPRDDRPESEPPGDVILGVYPPDVDPASLIGQWARGGRIMGGAS